MRIRWDFDADDVAKVRDFVKLHADNPLVRQRQERNLAQRKPATELPSFWRTMTCCLLTTQQRSGPDGAVSRFIQRTPFPLNYEAAKCSGDRPTFFASTMKAFPGLRRYQVIARELEENFVALNSGLWRDLSVELGRLRTSPPRSAEREVATILDDRLRGFGPKQARNLLQALGLTRYEIPVDSRIAAWLKKVAFPVPVNVRTLADRDYYEFVLDGIIELCDRCEIFPCVLDACIFVSYDGDKWTAKEARASLW